MVIADWASLVGRQIAARHTGGADDLEATSDLIDDCDLPAWYRADPRLRVLLPRPAR
ncbi:hypothetical protein [Streptomyces ochraceiscleroticus]|uniref:Uncharacterized protein n=1 Tax=Streptomyces ochraceiscleroticus TaxID=47761 RepID=A0ABW1ML61_9ACTN|nr:hypothetical protein [Streptomyces ochraceiscleroticus]